MTQTPKEKMSSILNAQVSDLASLKLREGAAQQAMSRITTAC